MRVTDRLVFDNAILSTGKAREASEAAMRRAASGSRVDHPSDDPAAAGLMQALGFSAARLEAVSRNAGLAQSELQSADSALDQVSNALARAQQLAVQMSNSTFGAQERGFAASEVQQLVSMVIAAGNTRFGNRWIFGGNRDGAPPFADGTDPVIPAGTYLGDAAVRQVEIAPGVLQDASIRGDVTWKGAGGGVDVIATLQGLQAALASNDTAAVRAALTPLDAAVGQVGAARSRVGASMDAFSTANAATKLAAGETQTRADKLGEVDIAESSIELAAAQRALEASLSVAAQGFQLSLLDYIT
ncbi:MAG: flagellar biosynthesis protein FlgL [Deltaproteobacteria bacterium]|nr:flagellar biosynthesis protein FlgL [Deltaproteobacteria bacterium]